MIFTSLILLSALGQAESFIKIDCSKFEMSNVVGKETPSLPIVTAKQFYKPMRIKNFGGDLLSSEKFSVETWQICGNTLWLLTEKSGEHQWVVRDALATPNYSKSESPLIEREHCEENGKKVKDVVAIVKVSEGSQLHPLKAWRADTVKKKFESVQSATLKCPNSLGEE